ncbi:hypothetical protein [Rugamonas sp. DEMB1]|uniref:hypothetical protein n=1 Tax=Rugamonas sp. DEMB1 TaxID=3039386 RepID=UPI002449B4C2|nr:hypothetical protein [Rugamonas sp. DEMB1]WGG48575.1 hypothetical protein QC826_18050 [Rugamonas sp. DEMB1]
MKRLRFLLFAVAGVPLLASAQAARVDTAAPQAGASATLPYQSAFAGYLPAPQPDLTPDKAWLQANSELAAGGGHAGHGMMSMHQDKAPAAGQAVPQQAQQARQGHAAAQAAPAAAAAASHQGHQAAPSSARPSSDPHQGHAAPRPASPAADPHQGHHMQMKGQ